MYIENYEDRFNEDRFLGRVSFAPFAAARTADAVQRHAVPFGGQSSHHACIKRFTLRPSTPKDRSAIVSVSRFQPTQ